jgi:hypothetical protein
MLADLAISTISLLMLCLRLSFTSPTSHSIESLDRATHDSLTHTLGPELERDLPEENSLVFVVYAGMVGESDNQ